MLIAPTTNQLTFCILFFFPFIDILLRQLLLSLDQAVATDVRLNVLLLVHRLNIHRLTFIVQQTLPSHIHRMGSVCLRHLGNKMQVPRNTASTAFL